MVAKTTVGCEMMTTLPGQLTSHCSVSPGLAGFLVAVVLLATPVSSVAEALFGPGSGVEPPLLGAFDPSPQR